MGLVGARSVEIVVGGAASLRAVRDIVRGSGDELLLDAFKLTDPGLAADVVGAARRGHAGVLLDPEFQDAQYRDLLHGAGVELAEYGTWPAKNHGKGVVGVRGAITTAALLPESAGRFDLTALLDEPSSEALRALQRATIAADGDGVCAAAEAGLEHGIVVNDPLHGVRTLTSSVEGLVDAARGSLLVATKRGGDDRIVAKLADRASHGVDVTFATRKVRGRDRDALLGATVHVHELGIEGGSVHANAIVADGRAYLGTAYLHHRPLGRGASIRQNRELGVIIDDPAAVDRITRAIHARIARG